MAKSAKATQDVELSNQRTICIPCEETEFSAKLIEWSKSNYLRPGDKIILVTVRSNYVRIGSSWPKTVIDFVAAYNQTEDDKSESRIRQYKELLSDYQVDIKVVHGNAKDVLLNYIQELKPNACILGRCRMHEAKKLLVGHVSGHLIRDLKVPTLVYNFD